MIGVRVGDRVRDSVSWGSLAPPPPTRAGRSFDGPLRGLTSRGALCQLCPGSGQRASSALSLSLTPEPEPEPEPEP